MPIQTQHKKILFTGPVGAGKTTAIQTMSDVSVMTTDEDASDMTKDRKSQTTVTMDYGYMNIGEKERIHLYGTPGQERFDFMWDILKNGALGLVLLIDNSRKNPQQDLKFYTESFKDFITSGELVIGVTKVDESSSPTIDDYRQCLIELSINAPIFSVDSREKSDISSLIQALLYSIDPGVAA
ncbi:MAG: ATP/GTP-binding protein [Cocleimonas sp.]|nr:ATP/GTP-binding protein [Cocleimonas sp.]